MLKIVSRRLSAVGRSPFHDGALSRRTLNDPAITLMLKNGRIAILQFQPCPLSNPNQFEPSLPIFQHLGHGRWRRPRGLEPGRRFPLREIEQIAIANQVQYFDTWG